MAKKKAWARESREDQDRRTAGALERPPLYLPELCRVLRAAGVQLVFRGGLTFAHPPERLTDAMLTSLRYYKLQILAAFQRLDLSVLDPHCCLRCGGEIVLREREKCEVCNRLSDRFYVVPPNSDEERRLLSTLEEVERQGRTALENPEKLSPLSPYPQGERTVGDSFTFCKPATVPTAQVVEPEGNKKRNNIGGDSGDTLSGIRHMRAPARREKPEIARQLSPLSPADQDGLGL